MRTIQLLRKDNIRVMGIPEGEERERGAESLFKEVIAESFPNQRRNWIYKSMKLREHLITSIQKDFLQWTSLLVQWLRIRLPMQGTWVRALVQEDTTCSGATKPVCHNYWSCALEPASHNY